MNTIHINTARHILDAHDPVSLRAWAKDGHIIDIDRCISLRYDRRAGIRHIKNLVSRDIITVRDILIFEVNSLEVFI